MKKINLQNDTPDRNNLIEDMKKFSEEIYKEPNSPMMRRNHKISKVVEIYNEIIANPLNKTEQNIKEMYYNLLFEDLKHLYNSKIPVNLYLVLTYKFECDLLRTEISTIPQNDKLTIIAYYNIEIDNYFNLEKLSPKSRNNFTKTVLENCHEEQKNDFLQQIFLLDPAKRDIFFQDLNDENIKLISQTIRVQKTNSSLKQDNLDQILAEVNNQVKARASRSDQFNGVSDGDPQSAVVSIKNAEKVTRRGPPPPYSPPK
jgi:hypothetical protein